MERISDERLKELMDDCEADSGCVFHDRDRDLASALRELVRLREGWVSNKLLVRGKAGSPIWAMRDGSPDAPIGIRFDCGDAGAVYVSEEQAEELRDSLDIPHRTFTPKEVYEGIIKLISNTGEVEKQEEK